MDSSRNAVVRVGNIDLACQTFGHGPRMLILHGGAGPMYQASFLDALALHFTVILPTHPGFHGCPRPNHVATIDDLAYLYLDLIDEHKLEDLTVLAFSMGGWIALEMATKSCKSLQRLVLVDSVGVKFTDRETRQFPDIFAISEAELHNLMFHNPSAMAIDFAAMSESELIALIANREAMTQYIWEPYLHNPKLVQRLHRVAIPVDCIWGESDGLASPQYGRQLTAALPSARFWLLPRAGHAPQIEQPDAFTSLVLSICRN